MPTSVDRAKVWEQWRETCPNNNENENYNDNDNGNSNASTNHVTMKATKIIGFSDFGYKEIAWKWYQEMEQLGYSEHMVAAQDQIAANYFREKGMRYDVIYTPLSSNSSNPSLSNFSSLRADCDEYYSQFNSAKQSQTYRRSLFGSRWNYVLRQLQEGYPVLMTDVDNVYTKYVPMSEMEESEFDVFHAYAGTYPSFPRNVFWKVGFTVCGGMSWLRPVAGVLDFVTTLVGRCHCEVLQCNCHCDDQVVTNGMISGDAVYKYIWDTPMAIPTSEEDISWEGRTGRCAKTGHRVKIWNRHTAFRRELDPNVCPDPARSWIAMPTVADRAKVWEQWRETCPSNRSFDASK